MSEREDMIKVDVDIESLQLSFDSLDEAWLYVRLARDYQDLECWVDGQCFVNVYDDYGETVGASCTVEVKGRSASVKSLVECWLLNKDALKEWLDTVWHERVKHESSGLRKHESSCRGRSLDQGA